MSSNKLITPIILAGGKGTRLWPLSREAMPKQFCDLGLENTLFQQSLLRARHDGLFTRPVVVCNEVHAEIVQNQAKDAGVDLERIICEPVGRDTAAAMALALLSLPEEKERIFLVMPSDHLIKDTRGFHQSVRQAGLAASHHQRIVTLGVTPDKPETGYGYIRAHSPAESCSNFIAPFQEILTFIEKPEREMAEILVQEPNVYWNAGVFVFPGGVVTGEFEHLAHNLLDTVQQAVARGVQSGKQFTPDHNIFAGVKPISFDYAIMEETSHGAMVPMQSDWSDLGSWEAFLCASELDADANCINGKVIDLDSKGSLISSDGPLVGAIGLEDMLVVATGDAVLVAPRNRAQDTRVLVEKMRLDHKALVHSHSHENRPWGQFKSLTKGQKHQVKEITVEPGGRLSLQYHFHRMEHWIVVRGIATVTVDEQIMQLSPSQQVFIPQGAVHRLENHGTETLEIIEVQYGDYLGEDDIVRVEDAYERTTPKPEKTIRKTA